jgi:hypothetical protein
LETDRKSGKAWALNLKVGYASGSSPSLPLMNSVPLDRQRGGIDQRVAILSGFIARWREQAGRCWQACRAQVLF